MPRCWGRARWRQGLLACSRCGEQRLRLLWHLGLLLLLLLLCCLCAWWDVSCGCMSLLLTSLRASLSLAVCCPVAHRNKLVPDCLLMLLLQLSSSFEAGAASAAGGAGSGGAAAARLLALLKERPYCLQVPAEERSNPQAIALLAVAGKHCWRRCRPPAACQPVGLAVCPPACLAVHKCCLHARRPGSTCMLIVTLLVI